VARVSEVAVLMSRPAMESLPMAKGVKRTLSFGDIADLHGKAWPRQQLITSGSTVRKQLQPLQSNVILAKSDQIANITSVGRHRRQPIYDLFNCRKVLGKVKIKTQRGVVLRSNTSLPLLLNNRNCGRHHYGDAQFAEFETGLVQPSFLDVLSLSAKTPRPSCSSR